MNSSRGALRRDILGALFAGAVVVAFCLLLLQFKPHVFWVDDYQISILPVFADVARSWSEGTLPLLSPYSWVCGNLAGEFQYGTFSLFVNAAVVVIWKFALNFHQQAAALSIAHLFVLASGAFLLARGRGLPPAIAVIVGLVGALNGWIMAWGASDWFGALAAFAWLPWSWWALEFALRETAPRWRVLWPAAFIYLLIAGGFPYTILMLVVVTAWLAMEAIVRTRNWRAPFRMAPGWILGMGLSAPAWLSLLEMSRGSRRAAEVFPPRQWLVPFDGLPGLILPAWTVDWVQFEGYTGPHPAIELACGFAPAVVVIAAAVMLRGRFFFANRWLLGLFGFTLLVCMLPGAGIFRFSFRWLPLVHLTFALLAGSALQAWLHDLRSTRPWARHNLGFWALLLLVVVTVAMAFSDQSTSVDVTRLPLWLLIIAAIWWLLDGAFRQRIVVRSAAAGTATFAAFLVTYVDMDLHGPVAKYSFSDALNAPPPLAPDRLYLSLYRSPAASYRSDQFAWSFGETVRPGSTSMFGGVRLINGYSPISPAGVGRLLDFGTHGQIHPARVDDVVLPESGPNGLLADLGIDGIIVAWDFELPRSLGPEWEIVREWTDGYVYHRREQLAHVRARVDERFSGAAIRIIENSRHRVIVDVTPSDPARPVSILFARPFFPGYQARLDGAALPVVAHQGLIPGIEIPAGRSGRLELLYRPRPVVMGGGVAIGSALITICATAWLRARARQAPAESVS